MSEQQYRVIADRDKGDDPSVLDAQDDDLLTFRKGREFEKDYLVRIERPVPTTTSLEPMHLSDAEAASFHAAMQDQHPSLPTREQIADYSELRADLATMTRQERTPDHWAIGRNQRTARSALIAIDTMLALLNGADR